MVIMQSPIVLDGDFNSQVTMSTGKTFNNITSMLNVLKDEITIFNTHLEFLHAGANMIRTDTFHASIYNLNHFAGIDIKESASVITKAASMARKAVLTHHYIRNRDPTNKKLCPKVVGFCGPYGASLGNGSEYTGAYGNDLSQNDLAKWHESRVKALLDAGVDILALGSVPCAKEAAAFVQTLRNFPTIQAWITFYCYNERILADGTDFRDIVKHCHRTMGNQMFAIGVSCIESSLVSPLLNSIQHVTFPHNIPLIACPDKTSYRLREDCTVEVNNTRTFFDLPISEWLDRGAGIIGGCCGTVANDIKYICSEIEKYNIKQQKKKYSAGPSSFKLSVTKTKL